MDPISFLLLVLLVYFLIKIVPVAYRIGVQIYRARQVYKETMRHFTQGGTFQADNRTYQQQSEPRESQTRKRHADGKIFSKDEGEYVDFEEV